MDKDQWDRWHRQEPTKFLLKKLGERFPLPWQTAEDWGRVRKLQGQAEVLKFIKELTRGTHE